jgi:hypothetical protein
MLLAFAGTGLGHQRAPLDLAETRDGRQPIQLSTNVVPSLECNKPRRAEDIRSGSGMLDSAECPRFLGEASELRPQPGTCKVDERFDLWYGNPSGWSQ